jgi:hypothetical protein
VYCTYGKHKIVDFGTLSEARFIPHSKAEVSKVVSKVIKNYSSKEGSFEVGGFGTFILIPALI